MGELSATLLAALRARSGRIHWLFTVDWPDGTEQMTSVTGRVSSATRGVFEPRVKQWGDFSQSVTDPDANLEDVSFSVTVEDPDGTIQARLANGMQIFNTRGHLELAAEGVPEADWYRPFSGFLDSVGSPGRGLRALGFRGLNVFSQTIKMKRVSQADFPFLHADAAGAVIPRIWGRLSGVGYKGVASVSGAVECLQVDTRLFWFLVCEGVAQVLCVYANGKPIPYGSDFTVIYPSLNGVTYTVIDFKRNSHRRHQITADVLGYDDEGDGSGTPLEAPGDIIDDVLKRLLSPTGASIVATPISIPDRLHGYGGFYLDEDITGIQLVSDLARSFNLRPYLNGDGLVAFAYDAEWPGEGASSDAPWLRYAQDQLVEVDAEGNQLGAGPSQEASGQDMAAGQIVTYARRPAETQSAKPAKRGVVYQDPAITLTSGDALARAGSSAFEELDLPFLAGLVESEPDSIVGKSKANAMPPVIARSWLEAWSIVGRLHDETFETGVRVWQDMSGANRNGDINPEDDATTNKLIQGEAAGMPAVYIGDTFPAIWVSAANLLGAAKAKTWFVVFKVREVSTDNADSSATNDCVFDVPNSTWGLFLRSSGNMVLRAESGGTKTVAVPWIADEYMVVCALHLGGKIYLGVNETRQAFMPSTRCGSTALTGDPVTLGTGYGDTSAPSSNRSRINIAAFVPFSIALDEAQRELVAQILRSRLRSWPTRGIARSVAAKRVLERRNFRNTVSLNLPLEWLDVPLLGRVAVTDPDVPGAESDSEAARRVHVIGERSIDPESNTVGVTLVDAGNQEVALWISARPIDGDPDLAPGLSVYPNVQLQPGMQRRTSVVFTPNLSSSYFLLEAMNASTQGVDRIRPGRTPICGPLVLPRGGYSTETADPLHVAGGLALSSRSGNQRTRSSFIGGTTGVTKVRAAVDKNDLLFPKTVSLQSLKFTIATSADSTCQWAASPAMDAAHRVFLSLDYKADQAKHFEMRVNRSGSGGKDYDPATDDFNQTPPFWFRVEAYEGHVDSRRRGRFFCRPFTVPSAETFQVTVRLPGTHGNGSYGHIYHLQTVYDDATNVLPRAWGFRVATSASALAYQIGNSIRIFNGNGTGEQIWPNLGGTLEATLAVLWNASEIAEDHPLLDLTYSSTHYYRILFEYNGGSPRLAFRVRGGAGAEVASTVSITGYGLGDLIRVVCRWSKDVGELTLPALTISTFVRKLPTFDQAGAPIEAGTDFVKGTDAVYTRPTVAADSTIWLGAAGAVTAGDDPGLDGILIDLRVVPRLMSDAELAAAS